MDQWNFVVGGLAGLLAPALISLRPCDYPDATPGPRNSWCCRTSNLPGPGHKRVQLCARTAPPEAITHAHTPATCPYVHPPTLRPHPHPLQMHPVYAAKAADPEGDYVRRWCPELARLPLEFIHQVRWGALGKLDQPAPRMSGRLGIRQEAPLAWPVGRCAAAGRALPRPPHLTNTRMRTQPWDSQPYECLALRLLVCPSTWSHPTVTRARSHGRRPCRCWRAQACAWAGTTPGPSSKTWRGHAGRVWPPW